MTSKRRRQDPDEDVLELRDLWSARTRALLLGTVALVVLVYAMGQLLDALSISLDQQEDLSDRLDDAHRQMRPQAATSSGSEPPKT